MEALGRAPGARTLILTPGSPSPHEPTGGSLGPRLGPRPPGGPAPRHLGPAPPSGPPRARASVAAQPGPHRSARRRRPAPRAPGVTTARNDGPDLGPRRCEAARPAGNRTSRHQRGGAPPRPREGPRRPLSRRHGPRCSALAGGTHSRASLPAPLPSPSLAAGRPAGSLSPPPRRPPRAERPAKAAASQSASSACRPRGLPGHRGAFRVTATSGPRAAPIGQLEQGPRRDWPGAQVWKRERRARGHWALAAGGSLVLGRGLCGRSFSWALSALQPEALVGAARLCKAPR